jgi:hypothetical protein
LSLSILKTSILGKTLLRKLKDKSQTGRKHSKYIYLKKELVSRIHKESLQFSDKTNNPIKMDKLLENVFKKKEISMTNKQMKRCSMLPVVR